MYSLVLMMALGNGATLPSIDTAPLPDVVSYARHGHTADRHNCHGRGGRHGGHRSHGCHGCYGSSCYGCYGGYGCACYGGYGGYGAYGAYGSYGSADVSARTEASATIVVSLPADAILTVNDQPTTSTSDRRILFSPPLQRDGKEYFYNLKAVINRQGQAIADTKRVNLLAGQETQVRFNFGGATVARE